jgi:hypothetical protein
VECHVGNFVGNVIQESWVNFEIRELEGGGEDYGIEGFSVCKHFAGDGAVGDGFDGIFVLRFGDGGDGCVEVRTGVSGCEHAGEDLPVATFNLHCPFDRHTDHSFEAMDEVKVLAIVDTSACLDDVRSERGTNLGLVSTISLRGSQYLLCWLPGTVLRSMKLWT